MVQPNLDPTYALAKDISDAQARIGRLEQADITIVGLHDVAVSGQTNGQALVWDSATQKWINAATASSLASLTDVQITSPTNAQVLTYNTALAKWINATGGGGSFTVSATAPVSPSNGAGWYNLSNGLIFFYINDGDSSQWVQDVSIANDAGLDSRVTALETFNTVAQPVNVGGTGATTLTSGGYLKGNGTSAITSQTGIPAGDITSGALAAAQMPSKTILQTVVGVYSGAEIGNSTSTYVDTGLTATITPTSSTSTILILIYQALLKNSNTTVAVNYKLFRGATDLGALGLGMLTTNAAVEWNGMQSFAYQDSPATTSAITYKTQFASSNGGPVVVANRGAAARMILMEIKA